VTEWDAYRALDLPRLRATMAEPVLVDLRNVYAPAEPRRHGLRYSSVGRR
jgi:UDPglucose 6-dehydrogenase